MTQFFENCASFVHFIAKTCILELIHDCSIGEIIPCIDWKTDCPKNIYFVRVFDFQTRDNFLKSANLHFYLKLLIRPWSIGYKIEVTFGGRYFRETACRPEASTWAVQLSIIKRNLHLLSKIFRSKSLRYFS